MVAVRLGALHDANGGWRVPLNAPLVMLIPMGAAGFGAVRKPIRHRQSRPASVSDGTRPERYRLIAARACPCWWSGPEV